MLPQASARSALFLILLLSTASNVDGSQGCERSVYYILRGQYDLADGKCYWSKRYLARHDVFYQGYNEGKGIWGVWELSAEHNNGLTARGGFHIWPEGMPDPSKPQLEEEADLPIAVEEPKEVVVG